MSEQSKRKSFSKKERYEIFKRDNFTCQYCGQEAPDIILEVDHIKPIAEDGSNDLTNLITSCRDCNRGKGARELNDNTEVKKRKKQLNELNKRRKQLEMMSEWRKELFDLKEEQIDQLSEYLSKLTEGRFSFSNSFRDKVREMLKNFNFEEIMEALEIAHDNYLKRDDEGEFTQDSADRALNKLGGICYMKKQDKENPHISKLHYIKGILRNRFNYFKEQDAIKWLTMAYDNGASLESLEDKAKLWESWNEFRDEIFNIINGEVD